MDGEKYKSVMGEGVGCGRDGVWRGGGGVCCLLVPVGCSCQVNVM